jgi:transcriptional regulatory protein RtcR
MKETVVFGFYGTTLDAGKSEARWGKWRPSVALCRHDDLVIDRFELLYSAPHTSTAELLAADIQQVSPETRVRLHGIALQDAWDFEEVFGALHEFSRSYRFEPEKKRYLVHITTGSHVMQICWFLLTESRHFPAQLIQTSPDSAKRSEPGHYRIIDLDLSRYDKLARRFRAEREDSVAVLKFGIATRNAAFNALIDAIETVALRSREPLLLTGPTGAGKSQLATQIYELKRGRRLLSGPLVEVNCATICGDGAMSTLFGHKRGAFTGAASDRKGLLRAADGGLLFLDEVGELGLDEQAMLLRAIESKRFLPVGSDSEVTSDFQLIAGTNRDLKAAVQQGRFREDLLARINVWTFELPRLAERPEDIEPNLDFELGRVGARLGHSVTINREARTEFLKFATSPSTPWTANFREFGAAVLRMATLAPAGRIDVPTVREEERRLLRSWSVAQPAGSDELARVVSQETLARLDPFDRVQLSEVLRVCRRSKSLSEAGRELFAVSRTQRSSVNDADRLRKYLARFELEWDDLRRARD